MPRPIHLRRGRLIDPSTGTDREQDLVIVDGVVARVGPGLAPPDGAVSVDASRFVVAPGFVDLHAHLREPGQEYKEDIATGSRSAAAGGFTSVCAMPNTVPPNDNRAVTELMLSRARQVNGVRVYPVGAISKGLKGEELSEIGDLKEAGVVAISDDGRPVMNARLMRRALEYGRNFDLPVVQHAEDLHLSDGGVMNEGENATRAGLRGQAPESEAVMVARDLALVALTGARYHVAHISTAETVDLVRDAKRKGLPVTCEVTPHHLTLTDAACLSYNTATKVNPPLRRQRDLEALRAALSEGIIDAVATDHAPHGTVDKEVEFDQAAFGMIGFETAWPLLMRQVEAGVLTLAQAVLRLTWAPAQTFSLPGGTLREGSPADLVCLDLEASWTVHPESLHSRSRNTPFAGETMKGRAVITMVNGRVLHDLHQVLQ